MAVISELKKSFTVGDNAPFSGVYRAIHVGHRADHNIIVIRGDEFPPCRFCKDSPQFVLVDQAEYIAHDLDFAGLPVAQVG